MGVAVGALVLGHVDRTDGEVVVAVVAVTRSQTLQEVADVLHEQRLVLVDNHSGRGVPAEDDHQAQGDACLLHELRHPVGDVHDPGSVPGRHLDSARGADEPQTLEPHGEPLAVEHFGHAHSQLLAPAALPMRRKTLRNRSESTIHRSPS